MRVLLTNDDGFYAKGINILKDIVQSFSSELWIVAPDRDRSGSSRLISIKKPIQVIEKNKNEYSIDGTPAECVMIALNGLMANQPDLILSGINCGVNVGNDVMYSGTIAAAMEGAVRNIPSIAFSQSYKNKNLPIDWTNAQGFVLKIINELLNNSSWNKTSTMNVNFPCIDVKGIKFIEQGKYPVSPNLECIKDQDGNESYVIHRIHSSILNGDGSVKAINDGYITITPLQSDLTDYNILGCL